MNFTSKLIAGLLVFGFVAESTHAQRPDRGGRGGGGGAGRGDRGSMSRGSSPSPRMDRPAPRSDRGSSSPRMERPAPRADRQAPAPRVDRPAPRMDRSTPAPRVDRQTPAPRNDRPVVRNDSYPRNDRGPVVRNDRAPRNDRGPVVRNDRAPRNDRGPVVRNDRGSVYRPAPRPNRSVVRRQVDTRGTRWNPSRPHRPVYRPARPTIYRPIYRAPVRNYYGTWNYHRPPMFRRVSYWNYHHNPYRSIFYSSLRWNRTWDYYGYIRTSYPNYLYMNWIYWPTIGYNNGYYVLNNYPYYVYNGYRYRYSSQDQCNYQLVDTYTHQVQRSFWSMNCNIGYDQCANERDRMNSYSNDFRYTCSETYRDQNYDFGRPTYEYGYNDYQANVSVATQPVPTIAPQSVPGPVGDYTDAEDDEIGEECYDYDYEADVCYDESEDGQVDGSIYNSQSEEYEEIIRN